MNRIQKKLVMYTMLVAIVPVSNLRSMEAPLPPSVKKGPERKRWSDAYLTKVLPEIQSLANRSNPEDALDLALALSALESAIVSANAGEKQSYLQTALTQLDKVISHSPEGFASWEREVISDLAENYKEQAEAEEAKKVKAPQQMPPVKSERRWSMSDLPEANDLLEKWKAAATKVVDYLVELDQVEAAQSALKKAKFEPKEREAYKYLQTALEHLNKILSKKRTRHQAVVFAVFGGNNIYRARQMIQDIAQHFKEQAEAGEKEAAAEASAATVPAIPAVPEKKPAAHAEAAKPAPAVSPSVQEAMKKSTEQRIFVRNIINNSPVDAFLELDYRYKVPPESHKIPIEAKHGFPFHDYIFPGAGRVLIRVNDKGGKLFFGSDAYVIWLTKSGMVALTREGAPGKFLQSFDLAGPIDVTISEQGQVFLKPLE